MLPTQKTTDRNLAYLLLRVFLGINIGVHGASRIYSGVGGFAAETVSQFAKTPLPSRLVYLFGVSLPFVETVIGVLIFLGLWSRLAYCVGFLLIIVLTFGSTLRQDWTAAGWQLLYAFAYAALLAFREHNVYSHFYVSAADRRRWTGWRSLRSRLVALHNGLSSRAIHRMHRENWPKRTLSTDNHV